MEDYQFRIIEGDDHVVNFAHNGLIKIGTLRNNLYSSIYNSLRDNLNYGHLRLPHGFVGQFTSLSWQCWPREGIDCEILFLGSSVWYKGKIRMTADINISINENIGQGTHIIQESKNYSKVLIDFKELHSIKLVLSFASENPNFFLPEMPESPLDEIRKQMREQENRERENNL